MRKLNRPTSAVLVAFAVLLSVTLTASSLHGAQVAPGNTLSLENRSGVSVEVELSGPTSATMEMESGATHLLTVEPGHFELRVRRADGPADRHSMMRTFDVIETESEYAAVSITLHELIVDDGRGEPESATETIETASPALDTPPATASRDGEASNRASRPLKMRLADEPGSDEATIEASPTAASQDPGPQMKVTVFVDVDERPTEIVIYDVEGEVVMTMQPKPGALEGLPVRSFRLTIDGRPVENLQQGAADLNKPLFFCFDESGGLIRNGDGPLLVDKFDAHQKVAGRYWFDGERSGRDYLLSRCANCAEETGRADVAFVWGG